MIGTIILFIIIGIIFLGFLYEGYREKEFTVGNLVVETGIISLFGWILTGGDNFPTPTDARIHAIAGLIFLVCLAIGVVYIIYRKIAGKNRYDN